MLPQREGGVVVDVHRAEQGAVLEQQAELFADVEEFVVGHVRDRLAVDENVAGVRVEQPDDVLDQHALAGPGGAEHHRDLVLGQAEVEAVEDAGAAELFDEVDDLDRVGAAVVALTAGVEAVWIVLLRIDAGNDEVPPHRRPVLADVGTGGGSAPGMPRGLGHRLGGDGLDRVADLRRLFAALLGLGLELLFFPAVLVLDQRQPPIGALGLAPQKTRVPNIPMMCTKTMLSTIDLAVAVPTPTGPPEAV